MCSVIFLKKNYCFAFSFLRDRHLYHQIENQQVICSDPMNKRKQFLTLQICYCCATALDHCFYRSKPGTGTCGRRLFNMATSEFCYRINTATKTSNAYAQSNFLRKFCHYRRFKFNIVLIQPCNNENFHKSFLTFKPLAVIMTSHPLGSLCLL